MNVFLKIKELFSFISKFIACVFLFYNVH